jgi:hypothetical protein
LQAKIAHEPLHCAARHLETFALHLPPNLAHAIHPEVLGEDAQDFRFESFVAFDAGSLPHRIPALGDTLMIG